MAQLRPPKLPAEVRDYRLDWSGFLGDDTIGTSEVVVTGATLDSGTNDDTSATIWLSGGTLGTTATITNTITTAGGRTETEVYTLSIGPDEPVSLAEAKAYLRVFSSDEDAKIEAMIPRARRWVEDYTGLALVQREFTELRRTEHNSIRLFKEPVASVDSVTYGDAETYAPRVVNGQLFPGLDAGWPALDEYDAFEITYTAGFDEGTVPDELIGAMLALIEGEFSEGYAYPARATEAAERSCGMQRRVSV